MAFCGDKAVGEVGDAAIGNGAAEDAGAGEGSKSGGGKAGDTGLDKEASGVALVLAAIATLILSLSRSATIFSLSTRVGEAEVGAVGGEDAGEAHEAAIGTSSKLEKPLNACTACAAAMDGEFAGDTACDGTVWADAADGDSACPCTGTPG